MLKYWSTIWHCDLSNVYSVKSIKNKIYSINIKYKRQPDTDLQYCSEQ